MNKQILEQYSQAKRESRDLENRIRLIDSRIQNQNFKNQKSETVTMGSKGSHSLGRVRIDGTDRDYSKTKTALLQLRLRYQTLQERLDGMAVEVEEYIQNIEDSRMRMIMRLRYTETRDGRQLTWREVAIRMNETEDSCRKAHDRYLEGDDRTITQS